MPDKYTLPPYVLSRVRYYDGEFLKDEDFIDEQKYHLDRGHRHQRLVHAPGIAEGLELSVIQDQSVFKLKVSAGTAVDNQGRQIVLGTDLLLAIKPEWVGTLWMTLRFNEKEDRPADANPTTGGVGGNTRFTQEPIIDVVADLAPLQALSPVVLGQVRFVTGQQPAILGTRTFAGVRLPGPGTSSYALQVTEERGAARPVVVGLKGPLDVQDLTVTGAQRNTGFLTVTDKVGIGTAAPGAKLHVVGGATLLGGDLTVGAGGSALLRVRHIDGKANPSDDPDHLYLNYSTGKLVIIGNPSVSSGLEVFGPAKIYGDRLRNSGGYSLLQTNATDALRINPDEQFPLVAVYKPLALGSGGLSVGDWSVQPTGQLKVTGNALVNGSVSVGSTQAPAGPLDVRVPGAGGWDRFVVTTTTAWGDGTTPYVTIGAGGAVGIMLANPHIVWHQGESRASIRYGRSGGVASGAWWDVGVRPNNAFSFSINGYTDHKLWLAPNGFVGIGTTDPKVKLHVVGGELYCTGSAIFGSGGNGSVRVRHIDGKTVGADNDDNLHLNWGNAKRVVVNNPGAPNGLDVYGTITEGGQLLSERYAYRDFLRSNNGAHTINMQDDRNFVLYSGGRAVWASGTSISDATLKREVTPIAGAMEKLRQVQGVSFFWKESELGSERELGVLAQEVETVFPELVHLMDGKHRLVRYEKFVPVLIQALKEQDERIARLEERLRTLGFTA